MISDINRSMLYICPDCSSVSVRTVTPFDFPKREQKNIYCSDKKCVSSIISLKTVKDKYKITVKCAVCEDAHVFTISQKTIWNKNFMILKCPKTGLGIIFIGNDLKRLEDEYNAQNEIVAGLLSYEDEFEEDSELDILFDVIEKINFLAKDNKIQCICKSKEISINIAINSITLVCKKCGKSITYEMDEDFLDMIFTTDFITID